MNALGIIQSMSRVVGIPVPSTAVASQSEDVQQLVELLNQEGRALSRRYAWQALTRQASFTTVATEVQGTLTAICGTQYVRNIKNDIIWNRSTQLPVCGPSLAQNWQARKALSLTGPYSDYRIRGDSLLFDPAPTAGQTCYLEFISSAWCQSAGGTLQVALGADSDTMILSDELLLAGLEWRYLRKKGLSYAEEFAEYEYQVKDAIGNDGTKTTIRMDDDPRYRGPGVFVPIGSWNIP